MLNLCSKKTLIIASLTVFLALAIISFAAISFVKHNAKNKPINFPNNVVRSVPEILKPGIVGEAPIEEKKPSTDPKNSETSKPEQSPARPLPPVIFNTSGDIQEIKSDYLTLNGKGDSFADNTSRILKVVFTSETAVFISTGSGKKTKYLGSEGMRQLKVGDKILVEGNENIRGKTEFTARTINILP